MGNVWRPIEIDLTSDHPFKVVFEANRGSGISISIDNVHISESVCPNSEYSLEPRISCNFENEELCGYQQDLSDDVDWKRYSAQDGVSGDGPDEDHTFGEDYGFYICMDQRRVPKLPGHRARIVSAIFNTTSDNDDHCIKFWYFLSGYDVGDINAFIYHDEQSQLMFNVQNDQSEIWHRAYFQVPSTVNSFKVGFESVRGVGEGIHCIDDVEIFEGSCEMLLTTDTPVVTTPEPVVDNANCDFETDCLYSLGEGESHLWLKSPASSEQHYRLPNTDHTTGTNSGHYAHMVRTTEYDRINLRTPKMHQQNHSKCLQFYFTMDTARGGDHLNVFIDYATIAFPTDPAWMVYSSNLYSKWTKAQVDIPPTDRDFSVVFQSVRVNSYNDGRVDVALDDIVFLDQDCSSVTPAPWHSTIDCDFESNDSCGYENKFSNVWTRINGTTPSQNTGPYNDHTLNTTEGHYMYVEASPPSFGGSRAQLVTPIIPKFDGPLCLQFWYNMFGEDIGYLTMYRLSPTSSALFSELGNKGRGWKLAKVAVNDYGSSGYMYTSYQVAFEATLGKGYRGDISIDDVKLLPYACDAVPDPEPVKSIDCDFEGGVGECGFTRNKQYAAWKHYDRKSTEVDIGLMSLFPERLTKLSNSFVFYDTVPYNSQISLISPPVIPARHHCLSLSYILERAHLSISVQNSTGITEMITLKRGYSPLWTSKKISFIMEGNDNFKVVFKAVYKLYENFLAIDNIKLTPGKCHDVPVEKLSCNFEKDCRMVVNLTDAEEPAWQLSTSTRYSLLPTYDHTYGTPAGHYFFISFPRTTYSDQKRLLRTPIMQRTGNKRCLQFYFYMDSYKSNLLNVYAEDSGLNHFPVDPIWRSYGSENSAKWMKASVDIPPTEGDFYVVFEPISQENVYSSIGIDDIIILKQKCSKVIEQEWKSTIDCEFEDNDICGYKPADEVRRESDFKWRINSGLTDTHDTGPQTDHTFEMSAAKKGSYAYIETSPPRKPGDIAILATPLIQPINTSVCLEFWYTMFGEDTGSLEIYRNIPAVNRYERLWRKEGQRSKRWLKAEVPLNTNYMDDNQDFIEHTSKIYFKGTVGYGYKGDIAIDDVKLIFKSCEPPPKVKDPLPVNETMCDFENGADGCGFKDFEEEGSGAEWNYFNVSSIKFDPTIDNDDPKVNMSKGQKSFIFADASDLRSGEHVVIMTPSVSSNLDCCLSFSYITMGDFIINIYSKQASGGEEEFIHQLAGESMADWSNTSVNIKASENPFKVVFEGVIGRDDGGFLALDDIIVNDGKCPTVAPIKHVVEDFEQKPAAEDNGRSTVSIVVIALLTIALLIAFAVVIFLILVIKSHRQRASSDSMIIEDVKSVEEKSSTID
ncbi:MAM and LDL-receptor class A domain-containing protein 1-like [Antedon mediterranea]|uniref:MAM and LDL-receptor class A domain-containing protein 1-like n=1 Tax=Antedon mediterranea TaxID=105859 RepID=UPI003AF61D0E